MTLTSVPITSWAATMVPCPFSHLHILECRGTQRSLAELLPHLQKLKILHICLLAKSENMLQYLAPLQDLRYIKIVFTNECRIAPDALVEVARQCKQLEELDISRHTFFPQGLCADADIARFASFLPQLKELRIETEHNLTAKLLLNLGLSCPELTYLELNSARFIGLPWYTSTRLFPHVENLSLKLVGEVGPSEERFIDFVHWHFPRLNSLRVFNTDKGFNTVRFETKCALTWPGKRPDITASDEL